MILSFLQQFHSKTTDYSAGLLFDCEGEKP